jgi:LysM repeat protein
MRPRRSPLRWLAPLALVACAFAVYSVVNATLLSSDEAPATSPTTGRTSTASHAKGGSASSKSTSRSKNTKAKRAYIIKSGDTLSSIAEKTGVSLERIQQLNPKLDSNALQTGQRVKLSP